MSAHVGGDVLAVAALDDHDGGVGVPVHNQDAPPKGIYWANGRWYILEPHPEGGRPLKRTKVYADARLSELHAIVEATACEHARGTLSYLRTRFEASTEFAELSAETKRDYRWCGEVACTTSSRMDRHSGSFRFRA